MFKMILATWLMVQPVHYDFPQDGETWRIPHVQAPSSTPACEAERRAWVHLRESLFNMMQAGVQVITLRREGRVRWIALRDHHDGRDLVSVLLRADLLRKMDAPSWCE
jgi:hypothetical protein